jgi:hypothetical protein
MSRKKFSLDRRRDFFLDIQPTDCKCPPDFAAGFCSGFFALPVGFIFRGDDANRVLKLGKRTLVLECQPWFYRRLVAYRYFWLSEAA